MENTHQNHLLPSNTSISDDYSEELDEILSDDLEDHKKKNNIINATQDDKKKLRRFTYAGTTTIIIGVIVALLSLVFLALTLFFPALFPVVAAIAPVIAVGSLLFGIFIGLIGFCIWMKGIDIEKERAQEQERVNNKSKNIEDITSELEVLKEDGMISMANESNNDLPSEESSQSLDLDKSIEKSLQNIHINNMKSDSDLESNSTEFNSSHIPKEINTSDKSIGCD